VRHILALDEGTTGVTAVVLGPDRRVLARRDEDFAQHYPRPGWVEHDAQEVWEVALRVGKAALADAGIAGSDLAAVGIANQRETTLLWERATGRPAARAIVWQDRRTAALCDRLRPEWERTVRRRTGLVVDPYFCATKLHWLLGRGGLRARARRGELAFGTMDSWLAWKLTGRHATDETNASRTMLWDIRKGAWDAELLELFGVPEAALPEVVPSGHVVGATSAFGGKVPVAALVGDQQAALFGQACFRAGEAKTTYGTGAFLLQHTGAEPVASRHGLLTTRAASLGAPRFVLEGSVFTAGAAVQWLRDGLGIIASSPEADAIAATVPDAAGVHVVPAFTGLGAPHWDAHARGAVLGLTRGATKAHLARAVLEAIAFQCADVVAAMERDSGLRVPRLRVDGGASQSGVLLQAQADLLRRPVVRPANPETTVLGAGWLAGIVAGLWSQADLRRPAEGDVAVRPRIPAAEAARRRARWRQAVAAARAFPA
jgi:glycerol kinase